MQSETSKSRNLVLISSKKQQQKNVNLTHFILLSVSLFFRLFVWKKSPLGSEVFFGAALRRSWKEAPLSLGGAEFLV